MIISPRQRRRILQDHSPLNFTQSLPLFFFNHHHQQVLLLSHPVPNPLTYSTVLLLRPFYATSPKILGFQNRHMEPSLPSPPCVSEMEPHPPVNETDITAPSIWDWGDLLDFSVDDHFSFSLTDATTTVDSTTAIIPPETTTTTTLAVIATTTTTTATQVSDRVALGSTTAIFPPETTTTPAVIATTTTTTATQVSDRVRKRDPRLTCSNFLAGRVPCACPEMDEQLRLEEKEEAEAVPGKKRARVARTGSGAVRCQVPGCGADISELKGYHKRHRVCLRCANASAVVVDGETKRYCQQCGKFHVLSDFDEGKRSCRMKLQRHNIIRRRKQPLDSSKGGVAEKESQGVLLFQVEENVCNAEEARKGEVFEKEALVESDDGRALTDPNSQSRNSDSCETLMDGGKDDSKFSFSPSNYENKSAYVPACPTGRISFKLYDWNPAEFPRRLRHQIFQWLASMPVELEGYIRPGCTILTAFIAMPTFMWAKLFEDPVSHLHDILACGKVLSKRGPMVVYLNNRIFHVMKDGITIMKVDMKARAPRLHYVHPICFEAGKPIEILACGSNLLQPKFQFLLSFAGKYLAQDYCVALPGLHDNGGCSFDHQLCKILIPQIEPNLLGPAFIEVENESGLSNFIPVLIADAEICSELKSIQQRFGLSNLTNSSQCEVSALKQKSFAEFLVDIAWLLKDPSSEDFQQILTSSQIQRLSYLLEFLLHYESTAILERVLQKLKIMIDKMEINSKVNGCSSDVEMSLLQRKMDHARNILCEKKAKNEGLYTVRERDCLPGSYSEMGIPSVALPSEDLEDQSNGQSGAMASSSSSVRSEKVPLLNQELVMNVNHIKGWPSKSCNPVASYRVGKSRHTLFVVAAFAVCFAVCTVLLHPHKVSRFAVTIRRCLTDRF